MSRVAKNPETSSQARHVAADARFPVQRVWMGQGGTCACGSRRRFCDAAADIATWTVRLIQANNDLQFRCGHAASSTRLSHKEQHVNASRDHPGKGWSPTRSGFAAAAKTWLLAQIEKKRAEASAESFVPERLAAEPSRHDP